MARFSSRKRLWVASFLAVLSFFTGNAFGASIPKGKNLAITFYETTGGYRTTVATGSAEAIVSQALINHGYPVVNEAKLSQIRKSKAAILALDGNVEAILSLGKRYGVNIFLTGKATIQGSKKNEFGLYTGTATLAVQAYSGTTGKYLFSGTTNAKEVGYTRDEASQKALDKAASMMAQDLLQGEGSAVAAKGAVRTLFVVISGVTSFAVPNQVLSICKGFSKTKDAKITSFQGGNAAIQMQYAGTLEELAETLSRKGLPLTITGKSSNAVYAQTL